MRQIQPVSYSERAVADLRRNTVHTKAGSRQTMHVLYSTTAVHVVRKLARPNHLSGHSEGYAEQKHHRVSTEGNHAYGGAGAHN